MARVSRLGEVVAGVAEGSILGALLAMVPVPVAPLVALGLIVALPATLVCEARRTWPRWNARDWLRAVARPLARVAACVVLLAVAAALPLKPLDRRVAIEAEVSVEDAVAALAKVGVHVKGAEAARDVRLVIAPSPRARTVVEAIARATGLTWRSRACVNGATLLTGTDGVVVRMVAVRRP